MVQVNKGSRAKIDWDSLDQKLNFEGLITNALESISTPDSRRVGRTNKPFVTSYQLASIVAELYPHVVTATGLQFGGKGAGAPQSFVQELAAELSSRIDLNSPEYDIEIEYLATDYVTAIHFSVNPDVHNENRAYESSVTGAGKEIAIFRLK